MIRTVVLFVAALGVADRVEASCVCYRSLAPCASFRDADRVFVGRVLEVKDRVESGTATVRFQVIRNGRGTRVGDQVTLAQTEPPAGCGLAPVLGERWVIYSHASGGVLAGLHACSGSHRLTNGDPVPVLPPEPGSVAGVATRWDERRGEHVPLADAAVWIDTEGRRIASRTSREGGFRLRHVPVGRHTVRVEAPLGELAETDVELASAEACAFERVSAQPGTGLVGRLVDASGAPLANVSVRARAVELGGGLPGDLEDASDRTRANGEFRLVGLEPGDYVVDVAYDDPPTGRLPYRHTFYPHAAEPARARAVHVDRRLVELGPFVLRSPVDVVTISAEIVCRDGTRPARGAVEAARLEGTAESDYATTPTAGRYAVRVVRGLRYRVTGFLEGRSRAPNGSVRASGAATASVETGSDTDVGPLRLVADVARCDAAGGPWIDR